MPNTSLSLRPDWAKVSQEEFRTSYRNLSSVDDLAYFWGITTTQINYHAYHSDKRKAYNTFLIPRRNGRTRKIEQPVRPLKYIQRIIHESLTRIYGPHPAVHGFVLGRSIVTNAKSHLRRRYILNIDLADFFPSVTRKRIYGRLVAEPYSLSPTVANVIASISTDVYAQLPQGSPCSPIIANMVAAQLDADMAELCRPLGCWYTRYADDITISTQRDEMPPAIARYPKALGTGQVVIGDALAEIIDENGFQLNARKSRLQSYWTRQMCTGLVVNGEQISVPRKYIRRLRSLLHHWEINGWRDAVSVLQTKENRSNVDTREKLLLHVLGKINYLRMVRGPNDAVSQRLSQVVTSIPQDH